MKTKALSSVILVSMLLSGTAGAEGFNTFDCLRDMMPLTEHGAYQRRRVEVERPFHAGEMYIVFPEVHLRKLTGFYVYGQGGAHYYDTIETRSNGEVKILPIAGLDSAKERPLYQMVAQPGGLETVTLYYMPGFDAGETNSSGPVVLGTSVLPIIGAFVSRPDKYAYVYQSPKDVADNRLKDWLAQNKGGRTPANSADQNIVRKLVTLSTRKKKEEAQIWKPLKEELRLRRAYVKDHNIDNRTFKQLTHVMRTTCKE